MKINLKEILIIFVLAVLVTGGSLVYINRVGTGCIGQDLVYRGFPRPFYVEYRHNPARTSGHPCGWISGELSQSFWIDLFFWFLFVFGSWQLIKFVRARIKK